MAFAMIGQADQKATDIGRVTVDQKVHVLGQPHAACRVTATPPTARKCKPWLASRANSFANEGSMVRGRLPDTATQERGVALEHASRCRAGSRERLPPTRLLRGS